MGPKCSILEVYGALLVPIGNLISVGRLRVWYSKSSVSLQSKGVLTVTECLMMFERLSENRYHVGIHLCILGHDYWTFQGWMLVEVNGFHSYLLIEILPKRWSGSLKCNELMVSLKDILQKLKERSVCILESHYGTALFKMGFSLWDYWFWELKWLGGARFRHSFLYGHFSKLSRAFEKSSTKWHI